MTAPRIRPNIALAVLCLSNFVASIDVTIVNVALPTLARELDANNGQLQWITDAYPLATAGLLLSAGNLGDRYGRRGWLCVGLALFAVASAVAARVNSAEALIAARAAMGLGAAIIYPTTLALITNVFVDSMQRARAIGLWSATAGIGLIVGPITGGWLLEHFWLGSIFLINAPIAVLAIVGASLFVPASCDPTRPPMDFAGLILSSTGVTTLTYTIIQAPGNGWSSGPTFAGFIAAAATLAAFVWQERRAPHPMLDLSIFADRRFSGGNIAVTAVYLALCGFVFVMTQYLQFVTAYTPLQAGVRLLPLAVSVAVVSVLAPRFAERWGAKSAVLAGLVLFAVAMAASGAFDAGTRYWVIAAAMALLGSGLGMTMAPATDLIMAALSRATAGVGSAVTGATRQLGACLGVAIVGSVFASVYTSKLDENAALQFLDPSARDTMRQSMAGAQHALGQLPAAPQPDIAQAVEGAFLRGLWVSCLVCAAIAVTAVVVVAKILPARTSSRPAHSKACDIDLTSPDLVVQPEG